MYVFGWLFVKWIHVIITSIWRICLLRKKGSPIFRFITTYLLKNDDAAGNDINYSNMLFAKLWETLFSGHKIAINFTLWVDIQYDRKIMELQLSGIFHLRLHHIPVILSRIMKTLLLYETQLLSSGWVDSVSYCDFDMPQFYISHHCCLNSCVHNWPERAQRV